jgi:hypothetical protein
MGSRENHLPAALREDLLDHCIRHHLGRHHRLLELVSRLGQLLNHRRTNPQWVNDTCIQSVLLLVTLDAASYLVRTFFA